MKYFETFILMPFGTNNEYGGGVDESEFVFKEIIEPGVKGAYKSYYPELRDHNESTICQELLKIKREIDRNQPGSITATIVKSIVNADVVIVDITGRNPNVFLELGIRYALRGKVTVLLVQDGKNIPFDIRGYRFIEYNKYKPAIKVKGVAS